MLYQSNTTNRKRKRIKYLPKSSREPTHSNSHPTVRMILTAYFAVGILLLHHYKSDLSLISDFDSYVIGLSKYER